MRKLTVVCDKASDVYDADTHLKLTKAATDFCEGFAKDWLGRHTGEEDDDQGMDFAGFMDEDEEGTVAGQVASPAAEPAGEAPSAKKRGTSGAARKRSAAEVASELYAWKKRPSSERRDDDSTEDAGGSDSEGTIDSLFAAVPTSEGSVKFNVRWAGHPNLKDWWQHLDAEIATQELADPQWWKGTVLELEDATEKRLGILRDFHEAEVEHSIDLANGVTARVSLLTCSLGGGAEGKVAWSMAPKYECCTLTDHAVDWSEDPALEKIKQEVPSHPTPI